MSAYQKRYLMIGLAFVVLMIAVGGYLIYQHERPVPIAKPKAEVFNPASLPDPPDPSIPKEMTIDFLEQSYHVYFESGPNRLGRISYRNGNSYFQIQQGTEKILHFRQNNSLRGEDALPDEQLRALARKTAALYTQNDLADYTVTDTCVFIPACLPNDSRHPEENRYFSVWTYGSEDPQTVAEESFVICLAAATGKFVSIETPEYWPFGNTFYQMVHDDRSFTYTYVQLGKTVPYPEMPDLSWLEAWYCEKHGLENNP